MLYHQVDDSLLFQNTQADKIIDHQQASYQKLWTSPLVQDQHPSFMQQQHE